MAKTKLEKIRERARAQFEAVEAVLKKFVPGDLGGLVDAVIEEDRDGRIVNSLMVNLGLTRVEALEVKDALNGTPCAKCKKWVPARRERLTVCEACRPKPSVN
jgi:hypothetical protein